MGEAAKVIKFEAQRVSSQLEIVNQPKLVAREKKYKKNGEEKKTHSNAKTGRSSWVDPIKNADDIGKILDYMNERIKYAGRKDYEWQWERNKLYFVIAIYSAFRVEDLIGARPGTKYKRTKNGKTYYEYPNWTGLKWNDLYEKNGKKLKNEITIRELKTSKNGNIPTRVVTLSEDSKVCIEKYVAKYHPDTRSSDYVFINRQNERLSSKTIDNFIKEVTEACGIEGNFSTHSLRKTCIYQMYIDLKEDKDESTAIGECMEFTGHKTVSAFLRYLGVHKDNNEKMINRLSARLSAVTKGKI